MNYNKVSSKTSERKEKYNKRKRNRRADPKYLSNTICEDSRKSDKKNNRDNDLTKEFIESLIKTGCSYCSETKLRMTLDRINNNLGHLQSNVVSACLRCNLARGDMPYEAWLCLVPGMRMAREKGLFGSWQGRVKYKSGIDV